MTVSTSIHVFVYSLIYLLFTTYATLSKTKNGIPNNIFNNQGARWFMRTQPESQIDDGSAMKAFVENRHVTKR